MLKAWLTTAILLISTELCSASTVSVEISFGAYANYYDCADLKCLDSGVGDGTEDALVSKEYSATIRFAVPYTAFQSNYVSDPFGRRELNFSGDTIVEFVLDGHPLSFLAPIRFGIADTWYSGTQPIFHTAGFFVDYILPIGTLKLDLVGERRTFTDVTPPPYPEAFEVNRTYFPQRWFGAIDGGSFYLGLGDSSLNVKITVNEPAPVPLPASGALMTFGILGLAVYRRRKIRGSQIQPPNLAVRATS